MKVSLFVPCFINHIYPQIAANTIKLLEKFDVEVDYNHKQACCGQPFYNSGFCDEALPLANKFLTDFASSQYIIVPSASCAVFVKNYYSDILTDSSSLAMFAQIKNRVVEVSDFLVNFLKQENTNAVFPHKVTFHDSCAALREYRLGNEPRVLLKNVKNIELVEMQDTHVCCGFGGTFSVKFEPISVAMVQQKVEFALATGAEYVTSTEASCLMNYESYIQKNRLPLKTIHYIDILT